MGQVIEVETIVADDIAVFLGNRSLTGQEGVGFGSAVEAKAGDDVSARLAGQLFDADDAIEHIYVVANQVSARRRSGWDKSSLAAAADVVSRLFVFYDR